MIFSKRKQAARDPRRADGAGAALLRSPTGPRRAVTAKQGVNIFSDAGSIAATARTATRMPTLRAALLGIALILCCALPMSGKISIGADGLVASQGPTGIAGSR